MNNSKKNRRLKSLWYKKEIDKWTMFKLKIKRYCDKKLVNDINFLYDMIVWNKKVNSELEIKYCPKCKDVEFLVSIDRYVCPKCNLTLGKHLRMIPSNFNSEYVISGWNNYQGRPEIFTLNTFIKNNKNILGRDTAKSIGVIFAINKKFLLENRKRMNKWEAKKLRNLNRCDFEQDYINVWVPQQERSEFGGFKRDELICLNSVTGY